MDAKSQWYTEWFDSPYYPLLYRHRNEEEAAKFIDNLVSYLNPAPYTRILDIACGRGRHALHLWQKGFYVTGIDLSSKNISLAKQNRSNHLHFFVHDMRNVFKKNKFDIALNLFTSFGYFEEEKDNCRVIESAAKSLKPNGIFVLDFMNVKKIISSLKKEEKKVIDGIVFHISRSVENGFILKKIKVKENVFEEKVKALTWCDFKKYFSQTGFQIHALFGSYELSNFDEKISDRLIIIAKKT